METMHSIKVTPEGQLQMECTQKDDIAAMKGMLRDIHNHLFVGNGTPSFMVRLDRAEGVIRAILVTVGTVAVAGVLSLCGIVFWHLFTVKP